jgi:alkanesulfonate monooxygenase SsuD/methylene tetrahydromethanopterin reductase-like flavin-dependent oxidoreductase (luciferase family)
MFSAFQVDPTSLVARFNEGLRLMKALWTEPRVNFGGRSWQLKDPAMSLSHSRSRIRRSGSAPAISMRCDARSGTATASSEPGRP